MLEQSKQLFSDGFRADFAQFIRRRCDVRRFRTDPVKEPLFERCMATFNRAPSVGLSEPWRIIRVQSDTARAAALSNYKAVNEQALAGYSSDKAQLYAGLKLSDVQDAPFGQPVAPK